MEDVKECSRCLFDSSFARIYSDGTCEYCKLHNELESQNNLADFPVVLQKIHKKGRKKKYDCIIGISGGLDSSVLLYAAVREWGLRPLVIHFDNGWNSHAAQWNMKKLREVLNVDVIVYHVNKREYDDLNWAFLDSGTSDSDIPNDIAMTKLMYETADKYGIKYILNGHCFRTEGSTPRDWTYMDAKYIQSVYEDYMGEKLRSYPLFTFWDQIKYGLKGIKQIRPFHFITHGEKNRLETAMKVCTQFRPYGAKHGENLYTEFVGSWWLPKKFGIDKRVVYLSAKVRSGIMTREEAAEEFKVKSEFDICQFPATYYDDIMSVFKHSKIKPRSTYKRYNFRKYRAIMWVLMKLGTIPRTMYIKYCINPTTK